MSHEPSPQRLLPKPKPVPLLPPAPEHPMLPAPEVRPALPPGRSPLALPPAQVHPALPPGPMHPALPPGRSPLLLPPPKTPLMLPPPSDAANKASEALGRAATDVRPENAQNLGQRAAESGKGNLNPGGQNPALDQAVKNAPPQAQQQVLKGAVESAKTADTPAQKSQGVQNAVNAAVESNDPKGALQEVAKAGASDPSLQTAEPANKAPTNSTAPESPHATPDAAHSAPDAANSAPDAAGNSTIGKSILGRFLGGVNLYGDITGAISKFKDGSENNNPLSTVSGWLNVAKGALDLGSMGQQEANFLTTNLGDVGSKAWRFLSNTTVGDAASSVFQMGRTGLSQLGSALTKPLSMADVAQGASSLWQGTRNVVGSTVNAAGSFLKEGGTAFLDEVGFNKGSMAPITDALGGAFRYAKNTSVTQALGDAGHGLGSLMNSGGDALRSAWQFANKPLNFGEMWTGVKNGVGAAKSEIGAFGKTADAGKFGTAANVVGGLLTGIDQFSGSNAETTAGKTVSATGAGVTNFLFNQGMPVTAVVDSLLGLGLGQINEKNADGSTDATRNGVKNSTIGNTLNKSIDTITSLGEGLITGETGGMEKTHEALKRGDGGMLLQGASAAGDSIAALTSGDSRAVSDFAEASQRGDYGFVGQFGAALGEGLADPGSVVDFYKDAISGWFR